MLIKKPMLAGKITDTDKIKFPVLGSIKVDGIRCLTDGKVALARSFKSIPNKYVQKLMASLPMDLDGELMISGMPFNQVQSIIMSEDKEVEFEFWVFDYVKTSISTPYLKRTEDLKEVKLPAFCKKLFPVVLNNMDELTAYEEKCLAEGHEGVMIRTFSSPYKCGRSSEKEGYLLKVKRFKDSEAEIVGFVEEMENTNEKTVNELGKSKRSSHLAGMVPKDTLGKFIVREIGDTPWKGKEFGIGTGEGLTKELRQEVWDNREDYMGKIVTYKYQPHGIKTLPRLPVWKSFRDPKDMS